MRARTKDVRVLLAINGLGPGGAERSLAEMLPHYMADGIAPSIVCLRRRSIGVTADVRDVGCPIRFLPPGGMPARVRALRAVLRSERVDVLHTTLFESDVAGRLAAAGTGIPVLTSLVNTTYEPVRLDDPNVSRTGLWAARVVDGWTARHLTTHFHAITEAVKASAVRALGIRAAAVTVIERGRSTERLGRRSAERRRQARTALGLGDGDDVLMCVGRQEFQKGHQYLLHALALLAQRHRRIRAVIVGRDGHATEQLSALHRRLGLGDRCLFLGHRDDVPELLAAADLFVFPSVYEGLGGAVIEAMGLGLPVVAFDIPALREVVEQDRNGLLVEPESAPALADAIARLLADRPLAAAFGRRSMEIFDSRFTIERSASRMIDLYHRVVTMARERSGQPTVVQHGGASA